MLCGSDEIMKKAVCKVCILIKIKNVVLVKV